MISAGLAILIGSIVSGIAASAANIYNNAKNIDYQEDANKQNIEMQEAINQSNIQQAEMSNAFSASEAQKSRDWQEYMSNTEVTRRMEDLQNAGINPLLAGSNFSASAPSSTTAYGQYSQSQSPRVQAPTSDISAITNAMQSITNTATMLYLMDSRKDIAKGYQDAMNYRSDSYKSARLASRVASSHYVNGSRYNVYTPSYK